MLNEVQKNTCYLLRKAMEHIYQKMINSNPEMEKKLNVKSQAQYGTEVLAWTGNLYTYTF